MLLELSAGLTIMFHIITMVTQYYANYVRLILTTIPTFKGILYSTLVGLILTTILHLQYSHVTVVPISYHVLTTTLCSISYCYAKK